MGFQKVHEPSKAYAKVSVNVHIFIRVSQPLLFVSMFCSIQAGEDIIRKGNGSEEHRLIIPKF